MKRAPIANITWLFVITRLLLVMVTYFGYILLTAPKYSSTAVDIAGLLTSWNHWDAVHYTNIAQFGYQSIYDTAFFPLFPLLIKAIALLIGNQGYLVIGQVLSNAALLGALFVLYQIAADALGERVGHRTLLYLCIFPTAFFFFAAYNESLFLLLTASTFLALRRQCWWLAGLLGLFSALTRSAGLLLIIPFLYEWWISLNKPVPSVRKKRRTLSPVGAGVAGMRGGEAGLALSATTFSASSSLNLESGTQSGEPYGNALNPYITNWRSFLKLLPILLIPLGTAIYCIYCWLTFGDPFAFATIQVHWARHLSWPWLGTWEALVDLFWNQPFGSFYEAHTLLDLTATIGFIALAILGWRKLRTSYNLWLALLLIYTLISPATTQHDALQSNQRFVLEMFPAFITLAFLGTKHPRLHQGLILIFPALQATLALLFVMNRWMV